jgi:hypothetical protein
MYEGQTLICKGIVEEHWVEYLKFVKKCSEEEEARAKRRMEALKDIDGVRTSTGNLVASKEVERPKYRYYDTSIQGFWNWYIANKV